MPKAPTIVVLYLDRPAVIPEINACAKALLADYGASDTAVLDVIFGKGHPEGKLPFELPSPWKRSGTKKRISPTIRKTRSILLAMACPMNE